MNQSLLVAMLLCVACGELPDDESGLDAGAMDADVVADAGADDGGGLIDKQNGSAGYPTEFATAADYAVMPESIKIIPQRYPNFFSLSDLWAYNIWGRERPVGSWYRVRSSAPTQSLVHIAPVGSQCHVGFFGGWCAGPTGRVDLACPTTLKWQAQPLQWRSKDLGGALSQVGWFWWTLDASLRWRTDAHLNISMPIMQVTVPVTAQNQLHCVYQTLVPGGWPFIDVWLARR